MARARPAFAFTLVFCLAPVSALARPTSRAPAHERPDGTIEVAGKTYASWEAFAASPAFIEGGYRCATPTPQVSFAVPGDCSFDETVISGEYEPGIDAWVIPVVFHLVETQDGTGHIPDEAVYSQIEILNEDFGALAGTPGAGGIDTRIRFVLARTDPAGNPTTGINRYVNDDWFYDDDYSTDLKQSVNWDPSRYLNIYTTDAGGALGYAHFPQLSTGDADDGVVLLYSAVGRNAPLSPYDQGRTATHEVGHYLGLFHTFQDGCGSSGAPYLTGDRIADTIAEDQPHYECTEAASACGGGNNPIHNYMDYSNDTCMTHFTAEQVNRIRCSVENYRSSLVTVLAGPMAAFSVTTSATDGKVMFVDESTDANGDIEQWDWDFGDGETSGERSPVHAYAASGKYEVTLTVTDAFGLSSSTTREIDVVVNAAPIASFTYVPDYLHVSFSTTSTDDGAIAAHAWDFGDGSTSTEASPRHDYPAAGSYEVSLTVTDDLGVTSTIATTIALEAPPPDAGGCGCEVGAHPKPQRAGWIFGLALAAIAIVRRRVSRHG